MAVRVGCDQCPWENVYPSAAVAAHAWRRHDCASNLAREARRRRVAARKADPGFERPCLHPRARHQHGTHAAYALDRCRCRACRDAAADYERQRTRRLLYGTWEPYVDAGPVKEHVASLMASGMGLKRIAAVAGVPHSVVTALVYGRKRGSGFQVRSRVAPATAQALLRVDYDPAEGALVDAVGTHRRIQAMVANGWSMAAVARECGMLGGNLAGILTRATIRRRTAQVVAAVYQDLSRRPAPASTHRERLSRSRALNFARARGWHPPDAWEDAEIDDPGTLPYGWSGQEDQVDEVIIDRLLHGHTSWQDLTSAERREAARALAGRGMSATAIGRVTHLNTDTVRRIVADAASTPRQ